MVEWLGLVRDKHTPAIAGREAEFKYLLGRLSVDCLRWALLSPLFVFWFYAPAFKERKEGKEKRPTTLVR